MWNVSVRPHGGRQCSGLVSWRRGPPRMHLGFKEGGLGFQEVDQAWNGGGGPARPLRRSSLEDGVTASAVVRVKESNPYFCGMRPCSYVD
ncbi:hypothetical protein PIB30_049127 [Stylosanthes scabra]|uniref:Uncharacterized protein n=1 Tax=Stylosanthes scabra TaxID=79078 RepID=A0ABU6WIA0_9FABA|nr:hypothetical protein [Stylosanthes scabra]